MKLLKFLFRLLLISFPLIYLFPQVNDSGNSKVRKVKQTTMTIKSAPLFTLQFSSNYNYGVYELSGNKNGDFDAEELQKGESFGVRHGIGGVITAKIPLHKQGYLRLNVSIMLNRFSSTFSKLFANNGKVQSANYNVISGCVGIENNFTPNYKIKTFIGGGIIASVISGKVNMYDNEVIMRNLSVVPAFRLGISVYSGLEYMLSKQIGLNCGFRFTHANLWLKQSKVSANPDEIYLNDKLISPKIPYSGFKQFAWGSFFMGLNLYFGIKDKQYIYIKH